MRLVSRPAIASPRPEASLIESVRHLAARFPEASLRDVALLRARELDRRADESGATRVWLAAESLQVTGSFKIRGALVAMDAKARAGATRVVAVSAGNHGVGVAYAARALGVKATILVPRTAPEAKRGKIAACGAELVVVGSDLYDDAEDAAKALAARESLPFVSPYDDVDVVLGNGTSLGLEIVRALGKVPDRMLVPFGGGGLATGIAWALAHEGDRARAVWGVQSEASCAMARSIERGAAIERLEPAGETFAEGLEGGIAASAFGRARGAIGGVVVVEERGIVMAMTHAFRDLGLVIEGSAAVSLSVVLDGLPAELRGGDVVVVLTGRNVDPSRLESAMALSRRPC